MLTVPHVGDLVLGEELDKVLPSPVWVQVPPMRFLNVVAMSVCNSSRTTIIAMGAGHGIDPQPNRVEPNEILGTGTVRTEREALPLVPGLKTEASWNRGPAGSSAR